MADQLMLLMLVPDLANDILTFEYQSAKAELRFGSTAGRLGVVGNSTSCFKSNSRSNGAAYGRSRGPVL